MLFDRLGTVLVCERRWACLNRRKWNAKGRLVEQIRSAPEAAVFVLVHHGEKLLEEYGFRVRFVAVPLEISTLPIHSPPVHAAGVGRLGYGFLDLLALVPPHWSNAEDHHALPFNAPCVIQLIPNFYGRAAAGEEVLHGGFDVGGLLCSEGHGQLPIGIAEPNSIY